MAVFSGKIQSAKFLDDNQKIIEVLFKEGKQYNSFNVVVDYNDSKFKDLINEYPMDKIAEYTDQYYKTITDRQHDAIAEKARHLFEEWRVKVQKVLDKQDNERYLHFEKYKEAELKKLENLMASMQSKTDQDINDKLEVFYKEMKMEVERQEKVIDAETRKRQDDLDADQARKEALLEKLTQEKYAEIEKFQKERSEELYKNADQYKLEQLQILEKEVDLQVQKRYKEVEDYRYQQSLEIKEEFRKRLSITMPDAPTSAGERLTTENVVKFWLEKQKDEDTIFKTKLAIFNTDEVKNHKDREKKMKVRKAKTLPELFAAYQECIT